MSYFPKVGDDVVINPGTRGYLPFFVKINETPVKISEIKTHPSNTDLFVVVLCPEIEGAPNGFAVDKAGIYWEMARDVSCHNIQPLFIKVGAQVIKNLDNLKQLNTDGRTSCAACGDPLKQPAGFGLLYRYCSRCEP